MSFVNFAEREINCKVVYYGPARAGKSTSLHHIFDQTSPDKRSKMTTLASETDQVLFFDLSMPALGEIRGFGLRLHLFTVPGQAQFEASRKLVLKGVDGVVFVADSRMERMEANRASMANLRTDLVAQGFDPGEIPLVMQYNKRDVPDLASLDELRRLHGYGPVPEFETIATTGHGVVATLDAIAGLVLQRLTKAG